MLHDEIVSASHARLEVTPNSVRITDLGSRNGTFDAWGGRLSGTHELATSQPVRLGNCSLTWVYSIAQAGGTRIMSDPPNPGAEDTFIIVLPMVFAYIDKAVDCFVARDAG